MQILRTVPASVIDYANGSFHQTIEPPNECPHCKNRGAFSALGYYSRNVTNMERGVLRILVRRFRCVVCRRTVSILPSFAQPYRLVLNATIAERSEGFTVVNTQLHRACAPICAPFPSP